MRLNIEKTALLKTTELFNKTPEEALIELAENSSSFLLKAGETLVSPKTVLEAVFIVFDGQLEIHDNNGSTRRLGKGDTVGYIEAILANNVDFFAIATEETEILKIDKNFLLSEIQINPELSTGIIISLCNKIKKAF